MTEMSRLIQDNRLFLDEPAGVLPGAPSPRPARLRRRRELPKDPFNRIPYETVVRSGAGAKAQGPDLAQRSIRTVPPFSASAYQEPISLLGEHRQHGPRTGSP
jgi:hypothetical protein